MSHAVAQVRGGVGLAVDIASLNSRAFWLVPVRVLRAARHLPATIFGSFSDALAARAAVDPAPPIAQHPALALRRDDAVEVDGAGPGTLAWIHANGDVRVRLAAAPELAEYYPIAAIRRAVEKPRRAPFVFEELQAGQAHREMRALGADLGGLRDGVLALSMRRGCDDAVIGVIACARPSRRQIDDGLTLEIRGVATAGDERIAAQRLLTGAGRRAAAQGYRRLVVRGSVAGQLGRALEAAGWDRVGYGCDAGASGAAGWWVKVLRVAEQGA